MQYFVTVNLFKFVEATGKTNFGSTTFRYKNKLVHIWDLIEVGEKTKLKFQKEESDRFSHHIVDSESTIEIEVGFKFRVSTFVRLFGSSVPFRFSDWGQGHFGTVINSSSFLDNVRGIRSFEGLGSSIKVYSLEKERLEAEARSLAAAEFLAGTVEATCGFELETQKSKDVKGMYDMDVYDYVQLKTETPSTIPMGIIRNCFDVDGETARSLRTSTWDQIESTYGPTARLKLALRWMNSFDWDDVESGFELPTPIDGVEIVRDSSVNGYEFRTIGPRTSEQFKGALKSVFSYDHTIDKACSFHIHLKVPGLELNFDRALRQNIILYLFNNKDRIPDSVLDRWKDREANRYFMPDSGTEKYNFINFHQLGTLEFRCFGNVQNFEDGMICHQLAVEALKYGLQAKGAAEDTSWGKWARDAMQDSTLESFTIAHQKYLEDQEIHTATIQEIIPTIQALKPLQFLQETS